MPDRIVWAHTPAAEMMRAIDFYAHVTQAPVVPVPGINDTVAVIGMLGADGGMIVRDDLSVGGTPSHSGPTIYLGANGDIDGMAARVAQAGG